MPMVAGRVDVGVGHEEARFVVYTEGQKSMWVSCLSDDQVPSTYAGQVFQNSVV